MHPTLLFDEVSSLERFPIRLTKRLLPQVTHFRRHPEVLARPLRPGEPRRATAWTSAVSDQVAMSSRHPLMPHVKYFARHILRPPQLREMIDTMIVQR